MTTNTKLESGKSYDIDAIRSQFAGWSNGESHIDGYSLDNYFDAAGRYLGADEDGVEPIFTESV